MDLCQGVDTHYAGMVRARKEVFDEEGLTEHTHYIASTESKGVFACRNLWFIWTLMPSGECPGGN